MILCRILSASVHRPEKFGFWSGWECFCVLVINDVEGGMVCVQPASVAYFWTPYFVLHSAKFNHSVKTPHAATFDFICMPQYIGYRSWMDYCSALRLWSLLINHILLLSAGALRLSAHCYSLLSIRKCQQMLTGKYFPLVDAKHGFWHRTTDCVWVHALFLIGV